MLNSCNKVNFWRNDVKSEAAPIADAVVDSRIASEPSPVRMRKGKRRSSSTGTSGGGVRFFLSKADNNGIPVMDREFSTEPEAILESLKTGKSYFVLSEWKGSADLSKKVPLIRKEVVSGRKQNLD